MSLFLLSGPRRKFGPGEVILDFSTAYSNFQSTYKWVYAARNVSTVTVTQPYGHRSGTGSAVAVGFVHRSAHTQQ